MSNSILFHSFDLAFPKYMKAFFNSLKIDIDLPIFYIQNSLNFKQ